METKLQWTLRVLKEIFLPLKKEHWNHSQYDTVSIMSFNLRGDKINDKTNSWVQRRESVIEMIKHEQPDIICCQEIWTQMVKYVMSKIGCNYKCYGRDTFYGTRFNTSCLITMGNCIFYNKHKFELIYKETFWLSDKTKYPNCTWGHEEPRNCVIVKLRDKITGKIYTIFNTHFDHTSEEARSRASELVINKMNDYKDTEIYVMGDFNASITESTLMRFNEFLYFPRPNTVKTTFNGFTTNKNKVIDYIITNNKNGEYMFKLIEDGYGVPYLSDHYPIILYKDRD
jgi:endonuclease/exonuclease/phosphatase family metal-dependent hydrolase